MQSEWSDSPEVWIVITRHQLDGYVDDVMGVFSTETKALAMAEHVQGIKGYRVDVEVIAWIVDGPPFDS